MPQSAGSTSISVRIADNEPAEPPINTVFSIVVQLVSRRDKINLQTLSVSPIGIVLLTIGLNRATHRQSVYAYGRLTYAYRYTLAFLAAGADAGIECHVIAYHRDAR